MEHKRPSHSVLGCYSKEGGDKCDLASYIPFSHPLHLPLPHHIHSSRYVALKILMPIEKEPLSPAAYEKSLHRFKREATVIATLNHPNIVQVYEYGEYLYEDDMSLPYIVMPLLTGKTLAEKLEREGPLPLREALLYIEQAAEALTHAHAKGVIHRDLKPNNFLFDANGQLVLSDFGIVHIQGSTLTELGEFIGTREYASPEGFCWRMALTMKAGKMVD